MYDYLSVHCRLWSERIGQDVSSSPGQTVHFINQVLTLSDVLKIMDAPKNGEQGWCSGESARLPPM